VPDGTGLQLQVICILNTIIPGCMPHNNDNIYFFEKLAQSDVAVYSMGNICVGLWTMVIFPTLASVTS